MPSHGSPRLVSLSGCISKGNVTALQIQFALRRCAKNSRTFVIEFTFPARYDDGRQPIAEDVHDPATLVHQFIDTENNSDTDRSQSCGDKRIERPQQNDE